MAYFPSAIRLCAALIAGVLFSQFIQLPCLPFFFAALICAAVAVKFYRQVRYFTTEQPQHRNARLFLYISLFSLAAGRGFLPSAPPSPGNAVNFSGQEETFRGIVDAPPVISTKRSSLRVRLIPFMNQVPSEGKVQVVLFYPADYEYGDLLEISGKIVQPPDSGRNFSYRTYLAREGVDVMLNNPRITLLEKGKGSRFLGMIYRLRTALSARVFELFPAPENALTAGILLGDESKITAELENAFERTGTSHIIAISGANFTLLTWSLLSLLRRIVPGWWSSVLMLPFILLYTILVGGNAAVVRAAVMSGLTMIGVCFGRNRNGVTSLMLTSALMLLVKPAYAFDLGFQLSATSTLGIMLFSEPLQSVLDRFLTRIKFFSPEQRLIISNTISDWLLISISAQIFTLWVSASAFGKISLISLFANFLIAPFQNWLMLGGFATLLLSYLLYPLGKLAACLVWPAPALTIRLVQWCAESRWASMSSSLTPWQCWLIIALIIYFWLGRRHIWTHVRTKFPVVLCLLMTSAIFLLWCKMALQADKRLKIEFFPTKNKPVLMVESPAHRKIVIASEQSNFDALELFENDIFFGNPVNIALIDFSESWQVGEFHSASIHRDAEMLCLNGTITRAPQDADTNGIGIISPGFALTADDVSLTEAGEYLKKRAWLVTYGEHRLLFPQGVPPERLDSAEQFSLIVLGNRDDVSAWQSLNIPLMDASPYSSLTIYSDGHLIWLE